MMKKIHELIFGSDLIVAIPVVLLAAGASSYLFISIVTGIFGNRNRAISNSDSGAGGGDISSELALLSNSDRRKKDEEIKQRQLGRKKYEAYYNLLKSTVDQQIDDEALRGAARQYEQERLVLKEEDEATIARIRNAEKAEIECKAIARNLTSSNPAVAGDAYDELWRRGCRQVEGKLVDPSQLKQSVSEDRTQTPINRKDDSSQTSNSAMSSKNATQYQRPDPLAGSKLLKSITGAN